MIELSDLLRMTSELETALASPSCWASCTLQYSPHVGVHSEGRQSILLDECLAMAALWSEIFKCLYNTQVHLTMGQLQKEVKSMVEESGDLVTSQDFRGLVSFLNIHGQILKHCIRPPCLHVCSSSLSNIFPLPGTDSPPACRTPIYPSKTWSAITSSVYLCLILFIPGRIIPLLLCTTVFGTHF